MGFTSTHFQPSLGNGFLSQAVINWHIHARHPSLTIKDYPVFASHSDVFIFTPDETAMRIIWTHPGRRPFGKPVPIQCEKCKAIDAWGPPESARNDEGERVRYTLECLGCKNVFTSKKKNSLILFSKKRGRKEKGEDWYIKRYVKVASMDVD